MRPAKLCFAFPLPQLPPEQTQPLPQGGLAFPSESRVDSFTSYPVAACVSDHSLACERIPQTKKIKTPRAAAPAAACVAGRSTGQHMLPQPPSVQTATASPPQNHKNKKRINTRLPRRRAGSRLSSGATAPNERSSARPAQRIKPSTLTPSCRHSVAARRRMTTPVVAPRSGFYPPPNLRGGGGFFCGWTGSRCGRGG